MQMPEVMNDEPIVIDFPEEDEKITSPHYTFRVGVFPDAQRVEVSIDDEGWMPCRNAVGFWWFDWSNYTSGSHSVVARVHLRDGHTFTTPPRSFRVEARLENPRPERPSHRGEGSSRFETVNRRR
jgi:hypothetical protein